MTRRTSHARRGKSNDGIPAWLWLVAGVVLGLALALAAIYGGIAPNLRRSPDLPQPATDRGGKPADGSAEAPASGTGKPRYDFYTVLPEMEVLIPDSELREQVRAETPPAGTQTPATPPPTAPSAVRYRLQAGSYRDPRPAEEAKARLALLGISATVQSVNVNGATYHRVYVGPYNSAAEVERVKQQLADNGVPAITVKEATP